MLLYLAGGNDGLNVVVAQRRRRHARPANYAAYANARKDLKRAIGPTQAGQPVGSRALKGPGDAAQLAFTNSVGLDAGNGDNGDANYGFDTFYGDGSGGPDSSWRSCPRSMP